MVAVKLQKALAICGFRSMLYQNCLGFIGNS